MFHVITGAAGVVDDAARQAVASAPGGSAGFRVQPDQVYELANRFDAIADKIEGGSWQEVVSLVVAAPGADKPSVDAAGRLTETAVGGAGLVTRLDAYVTELRQAATSLRMTGQQYGLTDHTEGGRLSAGNL
jgi:PE family